MPILEIQDLGLFTKSLLYDAPTSESFGSERISLEEISSKFKAMTSACDQGEVKSSVFSDYRESLFRKEGLFESQNMAAEFRKNFEELVVLGIGGSALGAKAVHSALKWSVSKSEYKKIRFLDNLDPIEFESLWSEIDPKKTAFAVISKSGGTLETLAQLTLIMDRYHPLGIDPFAHLIAVTDPGSGPLREFCASHGLKSLEVPSQVGGRFSVFTPVGTFPLFFSGIDVELFVQGAITQFQNTELDFARVVKLGFRISELESFGFSVLHLWPYASIFKDLGAWFVQLWGESLGKYSIFGNRSKGMMPMCSIGATDQHSILQYSMEGPNHSVNLFLQINNWPHIGTGSARLPRFEPEFSDLSFAAGHSFGEILNAEGNATETALREMGRPTCQISLESLSPKSLGTLMAFLMDLTVVTGATLGVNPFNQPGVELGKSILKKTLGKN